MGKIGNDYRDEFIRAMDDLRFRIDMGKNTNMDSGGMSAIDCFFFGICSYSRFDEYCRQVEQQLSEKVYEKTTRVFDKILLGTLDVFFDKGWNRDKSSLLKCDFELEQAKKYCAETVKHIAMAYVGELREFADFQRRMDEDYFSELVGREKRVASGRQLVC